MQKPKDILQTLQSAAEIVLNDTHLNDQQRTFMQHISKNIDVLYDTVAAIPSTEYALQHIMPILGDKFEQQLSVVYGYAKMLLEHPASFDNAELTPEQQPHVQAIYDGSILLAQIINQLKNDAFEERKAQHKGEPQRFDLNMVIWQNVPVLRYVIQNEAIKLSVQLPQGLPPVYVNAYHLTEIIQHCIVTLADELMAFGKLTMSAAYAEDVVQLSILAEGLTPSDDINQTLFIKDGREAYKKRIQQQGIALNIHPMQTIGMVVELGLPIAGRITV